MATFREVCQAGPVVLLDAAAAQVQAGLIPPAGEARWSAPTGESGVAVFQALEELGVNPKIAAFVPDEIEDLDELSEWLGEYGEVFGISFSDEPASTLDAGSIQAVEAMAAIEDDGIDPVLGMDLEARIQNASTREELQAILRG